MSGLTLVTLVIVIMKLFSHFRRKRRKRRGEWVGSRAGFQKLSDKDVYSDSDEENIEFDK